MPKGSEYCQLINTMSNDSPRGSKPVPDWLREWENEWNSNTGEKHLREANSKDAQLDCRFEVTDNK